MPDERALDEMLAKDAIAAERALNADLATIVRATRDIAAAHVDLAISLIMQTAP
jgi:hypothetical protein